jgi:hypothetical protein
VEKKEESVPACMLWSGAGKRGDRAGAHAREKGREGECAGTCWHTKLIRATTR